MLDAGGSNLRRGLEQLNLLAVGQAEVELLQCCGSIEWASRMAAQRPFSDCEHLRLKADQVWWSLTSRDWLEAFSSHPKIGEQKAATATQAQAWSTQEQASVSCATKETVAALAAANREYEQKFGYIFIVCATGKEPEEMLANLLIRLANNAAVELRIAAEEQRKITRLRLEKLLTSLDRPGV